MMIPTKTLFLSLAQGRQSTYTPADVVCSRAHK